MDLYDFFRSTLAWMATVTLLWPLTIPLAKLAYKIRQGHKPIDMEPDELWWRCTFASLILAVLTLAFFWVDVLLTDAEFPPGPVHLIILASFLAAGCWLFFVFFALEDFFQALSMLLIYLYLPLTVLYLFNLLIAWWSPPGWWRLLVNIALKWLKPVG